MSHIIDPNRSAYKDPRRWLNLLLVSLFLLLCWLPLSNMGGGEQPVTASASEPTSPSASVNPEKSIVRVHILWQAAVSTYDKNGPAEYAAELKGSCTGFFVDDETRDSASIATAAHCVEQGPEVVDQLKRELGDKARNNPAALATISNMDLQVKRTIRVMQPLGIEGAVLTTDPILVQVAGSWTDDDVALLRLNGFSKQVPALQFADNIPAVGDEVRAIGFPGNITLNTDEIRQAPSTTHGKVSSRQPSPTGAMFTELNADFGRGMSGGPLLDKEGHVIGLVSFMVDYQSFNFATDTENTRQDLRSLTHTDR